MDDRNQITLAYLRKTVLTLVRDEARRLARRPASSELPEDLPEAAETPLDRLILQQTFDHYRQALATLKPRDRILIIASLEKDWSVRDITARLPMKSVPATRVALSRALQRLTKQLKASARVDRAACSTASRGRPARIDPCIHSSMQGNTC